MALMDMNSGKYNYRLRELREFLRMIYLIEFVQICVILGKKGLKKANRHIRCMVESV
jgi:hypothetical protein